MAANELKNQKDAFEFFRGRFRKDKSFTSSDLLKYVSGWKWKSASTYWSKQFEPFLTRVPPNLRGRKAQANQQWRVTDVFLIVGTWPKFRGETGCTCSRRRDRRRKARPAGDARAASRAAPGAAPASVFPRPTSAAGGAWRRWRSRVACARQCNPAGGAGVAAPHALSLLNRHVAAACASLGPTLHLHGRGRCGALPDG